MSGRSRSSRAGLLAYELRRPGRHFRVEFDLTRPVAARRRPGASAEPIVQRPAAS